MKYEDALIEANNFAMVAKPGATYLVDVDYWYLKPFFAFIPEALRARGLGMKNTNEGWVITDEIRVG